MANRTLRAELESEGGEHPDALALIRLIRAAGGRLTPPRARNRLIRMAQVLHGLGQIQATHGECAAVLKVSINSLKRAFRAIPSLDQLYQQGVAEGKGNVKRAIYRKALGDWTDHKVTARGDVVAYPGAPDTFAAIWWTKNILGWADRSILETLAPGGDISQIGDRDLARLAVIAFKVLGIAEGDPRLKGLKLPQVEALTGGKVEIGHVDTPDRPGVKVGRSPQGGGNLTPMLPILPPASTSSPSFQPISDTPVTVASLQQPSSQSRSAIKSYLASGSNSPPVDSQANGSTSLSNTGPSKEASKISKPRAKRKSRLKEKPAAPAYSGCPRCRQHGQHLPGCLNDWRSG